MGNSRIHKRQLAAWALVLALSALWPGANAATPAEQRLKEIIVLAREHNPAALQLLRKEKDVLTKGASYANRLLYLKALRLGYANTGDFKQVYALDEAIIAAAAAEHDEAGIALGRLGSVSRHLDANEPLAALAVIAAISRDYPNLADPEYTVAAQAALGDIYNLRGQLDQSLKHYYSAIDTALANPQLWDRRDASLRIAVARVYINAKNPAKALETTAAISRQALPGPTACSLEFTNGIALVAQGKNQQGQEAFARALGLAREHGLRSREAQILGNISDAHLHAHEYAKAEQAARLALALANTISDANALMMANANIGFALAGQGRMADGLPYMDKVVSALRKAGAMGDLSNMLMEKSQALEAAGMFKEALATVRERDTVTTELALHERSKAIAALQEQFDAQQRSAQIAALTRDNRLKDVELGNHTLRLAVISLALLLTVLLSVIVVVLYRRSLRRSARLTAIASEFEHDSMHDPLTGLFNRRSFGEKMATRSASSAGDCFILIDIDHFKRINDEYGHPAGDAVLVEMGRRLASVVREHDAVVRWGGEEFLIYSHGVDPARRSAVLARILNVVVQAPFVLPNGTPLALTVSAGAVALPFLNLPEERFDWQQAICMADRALYHGKQHGRNCGHLVEGLEYAPGVDDLASACETAPMKLRQVLPT